MYIRKVTLCIGKQLTEAVTIFNELIAQREKKNLYNTHRTMYLTLNGPKIWTIYMVKWIPISKKYNYILNAYLII